MKKIQKILLGIILIVTFTSCNNNTDVPKETVEITPKIIPEESVINVVTSIVPVASITNYIGGEKVSVENLVPVGSSPHSFSMTPQDMIHIQESDLVFLLGIQDIDGFLFKSLSGVKSIALDAGLKVMEGSGKHDHGEHEEEHDEEEHDKEAHDHGEHDEEEHDEEEGTVSDYLAEEGEGHVHAESSIDPHVWTGRVNSLLIAKTIQEELTILQPRSKKIFQENYDRFEVEITQIFTDFSKKIEGKIQKEFIVFHDAYNYLLLDAGINIDKKLVFRMNVMSEPGSVQMKELVDEVELHGIRQFFVEPQFESKALKLLAEENDAEIMELDPLGSRIVAEGFLANISANLEALSNIYE